MNCAERWEKLPLSSDHLWHADHKGLPCGKCIHCGVENFDYDQRAHKRVLELYGWDENHRSTDGAAQ